MPSMLAPARAPQCWRSWTSLDAVIEEDTASRLKLLQVVEVRDVPCEDRQAVFPRGCE